MYELKNVKFLDFLDIPYLKIEDKKVTCIIGPSGSGKSTLLKLLNKMISPSSGEIFLEDKNLKDIDSVKLRRMAPMLNQDTLSFRGSLRDNLLMGRKLACQDLPDDNTLKQALKDVKLEKNLDDDISNLSGGEKQRVAIARLMLIDSKLILLDEPSSALDSDTEDFVISTLVNKCNKENKALIYVTHSDKLAEKYADELIKIKEGKVVNG